LLRSIESFVVFFEAPKWTLSLSYASMKAVFKSMKVWLSASKRDLAVSLPLSGGPDRFAESFGELC